MTRIFIAASLVLAPLPAIAQQSAIDLEEKKRWLEAVEQEDYFYWKRVLSQLDSPGWTPPQSYYIPRMIINGGEHPYFQTETDNPGISEDALDRAWDYALERNTQALLVLHKGVSIAERYAPGFHRGSLMNARSMTKSLMGILYGIAIEEGDIGSLDDPIGLYIEEWRDDPRGAITLRHFLHNVSGLEFPTDNTLGGKASRLMNGSYVDAVALSYEADVTPGAQFIHANANTQILGIALQRATGVSFDRYLSQKLWVPIGAQRAVMKQDRIDGSPVTFCCVQSSAGDWIRLGQLLLNDGRTAEGVQIVPSGWVHQMRKGSSENPNYGLHIWIGTPFTPVRSYAPHLEGGAVNTHSEPFLADDVFYLDGGAKTRVWIVPSQDLVIARLGNAPPRGLDFDEAFIPNTIIRGIEPSQRFSGDKN